MSPAYIEIIYLSQWFPKFYFKYLPDLFGQTILIYGICV